MNENLKEKEVEKNVNEEKQDLELATDKLLQKAKLSKEEKTKIERENLLSKLAANNLKDIRSKVAFILNHNPETRNSDIKLAFKYWKIFQSEQLPEGGSIDQAVMFKLERVPSLIRARAKIQNEFGLFLADEEVKVKRRSLEFKEKEEQLSDKPDIPIITYYIDESGKTQKYIIVGGLCTVDAYRMFQLRTHFFRWTLEKNIKHEFHFTELTKHKFEAYKEFFTEALSFSDSICFKAIVLRQEGLKRSVDEIISELHYQLVHKGMEHEVNTGRVTLPRIVSIYKDKEDGTDAITMTKIEQELKLGFKTHFEEKLKLETFEAVNSKANPFIQLADLYIGSISRILNREPGSSKNQKDDLAEYIVSTLGLDLEDDTSTYQDIAFVCRLD